MWSNRIDISQFIMQPVTFLMYDFDTLECMFTSNEKCLTLWQSVQGQMRMTVALTLTARTQPWYTNRSMSVRLPRHQLSC